MVIFQVEKSVCSKQCTPNISNFKNLLNEPTSTSPVINSTRMRRRTKRRIFKTISIAAETVTDLHNCANSMPSNNQDNSNKNDVIAMDTCDNMDNESISLETNNMQDFFCNASFANIDQICANFAENNDICNIENSNEMRSAKEISVKDNNTVQKKNVDVDRNECNEKKTLHSDNKVTLDVSMGNIGFSTASGKHIYVSESAISNAKSLLETDDIVSSTSIRLENKNNLHSNLKVKKELSSSFVTAGGRSLNISDKALSKAKKMLSEQLEDVQINNNLTNVKSSLETDDIVSSKSIRLENKSNLHSDLKVKKQSSSSFLTAGGRSLSISDKALSKAKKMLIEQLEDVQINNDLTNQLNKPVETIEVSKNINTNLKKSPVEKTVLSNIGFTTAAGRKVAVSKEAMNKAESLLSDDINNTGRYNNLFNKSINKRKSLHVCDGTLDKLSSGTKKVKLSNNDINVEKKNSNLCESTEGVQTSNTYSNEIMASTAALLADERDNDQIMEWISQVENCENNTPSSPVIGRQPVARKRGKKRNLRHSGKQKVVLSINSDINVNANEESVKTDDSCAKELVSMQKIDLESNIDLPNDNVTDILQKRLEAISEQVSDVT